MNARNHLSVISRFVPICFLAATLASGSFARVEGMDDAPAPILPPSASLQNGDVDGSSRIDITDVVHLVNFLFLGGPQPVAATCDSEEPDPSGEAATFTPSVQNGDVDGDGSRNITDVLRLVNWLYLGGEAPVAMSCVEASGTV